MRPHLLVPALLVVASVGCGHPAMRAVRPRAASTPSCQSLPLGPRADSGDLEQPALTGPAVTAIADGEVRSDVALDGDALRLTPPHSGDTAGYAGDDAACEVLASSLANGFPVPNEEGRFLIGLGRVSVWSDLLVGHSRGGDVREISSSGGVPDVQPTRPPAAAYDDRLAWVVVVPEEDRSSCPNAAAGAPMPSRSDEPDHHGYAVFVVDAATGGDALLYTERQNGICSGASAQGPWVDVPLTDLSVPWQLVDEQPDRTSGRIRFEAHHCEGRPGAVSTDERPGLVRVVVTRPFGQPCGTSEQVTVQVRARNVGDLLPETELEHAPVGPYRDR